MNAKQVWQAALGELEPQVDKGTYGLLAGSDIIGMREDTILVGVANSFTVNWLERKVNGEVAASLANILGYEVGVHFVLRGGSDGAESGAMDWANEQTTVRLRAAEPWPPRLATPMPGNKAKERGNGKTMRRNGNDDDHSVDTNYSSFYEQPYGASRTAGSGARRSSSTGGNGYSGSGYSGNGGYRPQTGYAAPAPRPRRNGGSDFGRQMEFSMDDSQLNPKYVFEDFIVGSSNRLAHAASMAVAEQPAEIYNPLFLYGGVGLGKTHLLHAIGNRAMQNNKNMRVLYVSSERFTNEMINAIGDRRTEEFRARYRTIDVLLIDDIQFIAGKESTQEEFFHTFNSLHQSGKQIVISSDRPPKAILTLEDRLCSRFEGGLIADVQSPDLETRTAILRAKAQHQQVPVPLDVIDFVAHKVQSNIRELEGALTRIIAYTSLNNAKLTVQLAAEALNDLSANTRRRSITAPRVIDAVATFYNLDAAELRGKLRSREVVVPRQIAMYIIREETEASLAEIGDAFGGRDHTTVMHSCEKIEQAIESDSSLRQDVLSLRQMLYNDTK